MEDSISSLEKLSIPEAKHSDDDASTAVHERNDESIDVEDVDREMHLLFASKMRDNAKMRSHCHSKVAVLLIDWEKNSEGGLDTDKEVNRLQRLFEKKYHYVTQRKRLNTDLRQPVYKQMQKFLVDFTYDFDTDETLLIIYYAGHGLNDIKCPGTLKLFGSSTKPYPNKRHLNYIVWNQAEELIKDTKGDKLLIFDCCYAGELASSNKRGPALGKIFDFLGATQSNERAMPPGYYSFTTALTWALNEYSSHTDGFTVQQLRQKIQTAPNFQEFPDPCHHQSSCIGDRAPEPTLRQLKMRPLPQDGQLSNDNPDDLAHANSYQQKYYLTLEFLFSSCPIPEDITFLAKDLQDLIAHKDYPLDHVFWRGLFMQPKGTMKFRDAVGLLMRERKGTTQSTSTPNIRIEAAPTSAEAIKASVIDAKRKNTGSATALTVYNGPASPEDIRLAFWRLLRPSEKQNYFYATVIIQKRSWVLLCLGVLFVFTLGYMLPEHHPHSVSLWPSWNGSFGGIWQYLVAQRWTPRTVGDEV